MLAAAVSTLLAVLAAPVASADQPVTETTIKISGVRERDQAPVTLDASVFRTGGSRPEAAIVLAHGFGGSKADLAPTARALAGHGYLVLTYSARGFGESGGMIHLNDPAYEGKDIRRIIGTLAARPDVIKEAGDPVVGFAGASYGGAAALLAGGLDPRIDAIVPAFTYSSLGSALFGQYAATSAPRTPAGLQPISAPGVFKKRWAALFFLGGGSSTSSADLCGRFTPELCHAYLATAETGRPDQALLKLLARSNLQPVVHQITAPTLLVQGERDTLFPLDQADANLRALPPTTTAKMRWVSGGHDAQIDIQSLLPQLEAWFSRYLARDGTAADTRFEFDVPSTSLVADDSSAEPDVRSVAAYPGRSTTMATRHVGLSSSEPPGTGSPRAAQPVLSPPGGVPAALTSLPGTGGVLSQVSAAGGYPLAVLPGQSATFTSDPLAEPLTLVGSATIPVSVTSSTGGATLFASLWDLGPASPATPRPGTASAEQASGGRPTSAILPQLAVAPVRLAGLAPGRPRTVQLVLPSVVHDVPVGHRLQLVIASTDQAYAVPDQASVYQIAVAPGAALTIPQLGGAALETAAFHVPLPLVIVVAALLLAAVLAMIMGWRRRHAAHPRTELRQIPLQVEDLVKTYGDGYRAVDRVSFSAQAGQVVGLLGPNGAGKTTIMRMLVGLIRPDSGQIWVHGEPVHAGADVLGMVGAFIEGPGFLPHFTGAQNLAAYWSATGRPAADSHLAEALQIAGLGSAIDKPVRSYSQGMRQRLGIAQAMLGLPELLLLDEPTNGLDPPQIKTMRTVLADYAAQGGTAVVSSHLLSEVQQTCSHVMVMDRGKVVLSGAVEELTASDDVTLIGLAAGSDLAAAERRLQAGGLETRREGELIRAEGEVARGEVVRILVDSGYAIESVDGHRQLEDIFMNLVGAPTEEPGNR